MQVREVVRPTDPYTQSLLALKVWSGLTITFSFPTAAQYSGYSSSGDPLASFAPFNDQQKAAVRHILETISSFTNLTFVEVTGANAGSATLRFGNTGATDTAFAFLPASDELGGDSWYGNHDYMLSPVIGTYAYMTVMHEIGHALGLVHPHDPDVGNPMPADRDWMAYTVMSYRSAPNGPEGYYNGDSDFAQTFMLEDIAALQHAYGANYITNADDTVYSFSPTTGEYSINGAGQGTPADNVLFVTIWDGGGTDTYDFSAYTQGGTIDLQPGEWSRFYPIQLAQLGSGNTPPGSVANAYMFNGDTRSLIENAIGGSGSDYINGNQAANHIWGGAGSDTILGFGGNDTLYGGLDNDELQGGEGADVLYGESGNDRLYGDGGADVLRGGAGEDSLIGGDGDDLLYGGAGGDYFEGGAGNDRLVGGDGQNSMYGGEGDDVLLGGAEEDYLSGGSGTDRLEGGAGNDTYVWDDPADTLVEVAGGGIDTVESHFDWVSTPHFENVHLVSVSAFNATGNADANQLIGNDNDNVLDGRGGADSMSGQRGDDIYYVDHVNDEVIEVSGNGTDTIYSSASIALSRGFWSGGGASVPVYWHYGDIEILILTGSANINATGNEIANTITGNSGNNLITGAEGDDTLDGGAGTDTAVFSGLRSAYAIDEISWGVFRIVGPDGSDTLENIEYARFDDMTLELIAPSPPGTIFGTLGDDVLIGGDGDDLFNVSQGGDDTVDGGLGDDGFYMGAALNALDDLDGQGGTLDQLGLQGDYAGYTFSGSNLTNIEMLVLLSGADTRFGDTGGNLYSYDLTTIDANVGAGQELIVSFNTLLAGENVTFDGSAETDGSFFIYGGLGNDVLTGGAQDDRFYFGAEGRWGAGDQVTGGAGTMDQLGLQGLYTGATAVSFGAGQLNGIEMLVLLSGGDTRFGSGGLGYSYDITMHDDNVAADQLFYVSANTLRADETLTFNGAAETDARFTVYGGLGADTIIGGAGADELWGRGGDDVLTGGLGADVLRGGDGNDQFVYLSAADSTTAAPDLISDFVSGDTIDLSGIDAITGGGDDAFSFIGAADFSGTTPGELRYANVNGNTVIQGDIDGDGVADFEIQLTGTITLQEADFIL